MLHENATKVYDGARFDVVALSLPKRGGGTMARQVVRPADAVVILPLLDATPGSETVVLIRNERFAVDQTLWELPAGTLEAGEDPAACAGRELIEETGYEADGVTELLSFYPSPGFCTEKLTAFRATGLTFRGQDLDETERITVEPTPMAEALAMVKDNRIRDAKTIATLLYHAAFGIQG